MTRGRARAGRLFLTAWAVFTLLFATNIVREYYPAFSLAERGTLRVDPYLGLHPDLFAVEGRGGFINNNPGASIVGALPYALARPAVDRVVARVAARRAEAGPPPTEYDDPRPLRRKFFRQVREQGLDVRFGLASGVIQVGAAAPLSALAVVVLWHVLGRLGFARRDAVLLGLLFAFGTPLLFRSAFLSQNLLVAHLTLFAFAALGPQPAGAAPRAPSPARLAAAGLLAGLTMLCDYSGVVPVAALGLYGLHRCTAGLGAARGSRRALWMVAAGALGAGTLLAYQWWAFGHPLFPAQRYMPDTEYSGFGWNGVNWPALDLALQNLVDPRFGLFTAGPVLLLAFAEPWAARRPGPRLGGAERALVLGLFLGIWLFASSIEYARLQWNTGVRYLMPAVPFLFLAASAVLVRLPRGLAVALGVAAVGWCTAHAMVRETPWDSLVAVVQQGPQLPWLTSIWRTGARAPVLLGEDGPSAWPLLVPAAAALGALWWPEVRRRGGTRDEGEDRALGPEERAT